MAVVVVMMGGIGCKPSVVDAGACKAAQDYLPKWTKEHTIGSTSAISNVRCDEFTSDVAAGSAETTIKFDEDVGGLGTFHRRGTVHFQKSERGWEVTLANIS